MQPLTRPTAEEYASWFKVLADATRIQIVSLLARCGRKMTVGEIVELMGVGQSTVSQHLKQLAEVGFVLVERVGTASHYRINEECVRAFPSAADVVMGQAASVPPGKECTR
ncbi:ArsR/SmtB family transcription factor [Streptomyces sp. NPDC048172]|uniref:ArsR/SmtB family transcription factor n=1 Tax=Streptomyces sp. NPDC048172 TaxID=3365505 RepID=UPI00371BA474